ncbi:unnamed protein product, partial [Brassica oleracea]
KKTPFNGYKGLLFVELQYLRKMMKAIKRLLDFDFQDLVILEGLYTVFGISPPPPLAQFLNRGLHTLSLPETAKPEVAAICKIIAWMNFVLLPRSSDMMNFVFPVHGLSLYTFYVAIHSLFE